MASADLEPVMDAHLVRVSVHVEAGHVSHGTGARLVDAVLDAPEMSEVRAAVRTALGGRERAPRAA